MLTVRAGLLVSLFSIMVALATAVLLAQLTNWSWRVKLRMSARLGMLGCVTVTAGVWRSGRPGH